MFTGIIGKGCNHKWAKWSKVVDTRTSFKKAQFRKCDKCDAIDYRFIELLHHGNSGNVPAEVIDKEVGL